LRGERLAPREEVRVLDHGDRLAAGRLEGAAPTLVRLSGRHPHVAAEEPVMLRAEVVAVHADGLVPTGTVAFRAGHRLLGTAPLDVGGVACLDGVRLPAGVHALVASYGGDDCHAAASSAPVPQAVVVPKQTVLVAVQVPGRGTGSALLSAELLDPANGRLVETASGSVTFAVDGQVLGSAPLRGGEAELRLATVPPGRLTARYHGDVEHAAADGIAPPEAGPSVPAQAGSG
jgi:hypothetical protein